MSIPQEILREIEDERERFRITLASIGDAVVSVDREGRVVFLNAVAESLTGWSIEDARGVSIERVVPLIDETTRIPIENPGMRALREARTLTLANHTLLLAKDGVERPIADSASPMRDGTGATVGAVLVFRDVTEQKRTDEARARLAAIVETSDDAIVSKTLDGVIRSWNAAAERLFGWSREEAVGRSITLIIPPEHIAEEQEILRRLRNGERIDHFETVRVAKDGRRLDISLTVSPVKDRDGRVIGASKIARDVTERKRAAEALRASEGRHRFLAELGVSISTISDPEQVMATTARLLCEHLGTDRCAYAEVERESVFVITGDYSRGVPSIVGRWPISAFGEACERSMRVNVPYVVEDIESDSRLLPADLEAYRATNIRAVICVPLHKAGRLEAAMAVHQVTPRRWTDLEIQLVRTVVIRSWESIERSRVERGMKQTAAHLSLALAAASLGDWSWDTRTDMVTLSERAAEIFGLPPNLPITWAELSKLLHEEDAERTRSAVREAVETGGKYDVEYRVRRPAGDEVWIAAKGRAQYDALGNPLGMFGVLQDITEKKHLLRELEQRAEQLAESDRKKDEFIALLAHELRNPLAPVRTGLQVMRLAAGDPTAVTRARDMMDRQLGHMVRLIDDLLDVSRMNRNKLNLQKARMLLSDVVSHAVEAVHPAVSAAGHQLEVKLPDAPIVLEADLTRLAQVFGNLLMNSAKYTNPGGTITLSARQEGAEAIVEVKDNGIGIPREALPRIFDMFSQVDRAVERESGGLGIGLALVKGLVEMHGGTVSADSEGPGTGSTFTVRLPADRSDAPKPGSITGSFAHIRARRRRRKVLVVDDNRDAAESMAEMLSLLGNEVHTAHDGEEAVQVADRERPDLVLMDVGMPRVDGLEATRRIREQPWGTTMTIIALTGWGQSSDRARTKEAGCDSHMVKPVGLPDLERVLAEPPRS